VFGFTTQLIGEVLNEGPERNWFRLHEPLVFEFGDDSNPSVVTVPAGSMTDFASVPRVLWAKYPPIGKYSAAAAVHDDLYHGGAIVTGVKTWYPTREQADWIFYEAMDCLKVDHETRNALYEGVKIGGQQAWDEGHAG
jgi:hypothetical protein